MESVASKKTYLQPMTMAELLPGLSGILSKDTIQTLTAKKKPRSTLALTRTSEKNVKPLTIAEMRADILALRVPSPRRFAQPTTSTKKKMWNASVKVDNKTKSHTADGQLKNNPVRKVLNFQPKPKAVPPPRMTVTPEIRKLSKPELRAKKTFHLQAKNTVRISGVFNMPETPNISSIPIKNRMTLANKENCAPRANVIQKGSATPTVNKKYVPPLPDTPLVNMSGNDTSFLEREKEVHDFEVKAKALAEEPTLENIAEVSPPVSTPFKEYRNVQEFFNHSHDTDNSALYDDNTIMNFDKISKESSKREESVIVTLCELLNKASVANVEEPKTELNDLLKVKEQMEYNLKMVENGIKMLNSIKESQIKSLQYVKKVIKEKKMESNIKIENNNTPIKTEKTIHKDGDKLIETSPVSSKPCSVIKSKSPSYKIPKKTNPCLRKKILHKSMPNVSEGLITPDKDMDKRAFNIYMEMKKNEMKFLSTPCAKQKKAEVPDTPTVTSHNLQMQLNKIYKDDP